MDLLFAGSHKSNLGMGQRGSMSSGLTESMSPGCQGSACVILWMSQIQTHAKHNQITISSSSLHLMCFQCSIPSFLHTLLLFGFVLPSSSILLCFDVYCTCVCFIIVISTLVQRSISHKQLAVRRSIYDLHSYTISFLHS